MFDSSVLAANPVRYAAYGSNLHPVRLQERVRSAVLLGTSVLEGWQLHFHKRGKDGSGKCSLLPDHSRVYVAVYEMPVTQRLALDRAEGLYSGYDARTLDVPRFGECFTYLAAETHVDETLRPFCWYKALVLAGCEALGFPRSYVAGIRAVAHSMDDDGIRHDKHMSLVRRARNST